VDLELSPAHKIIVHLRKVEEVAPSVLRSLVAANQNRKTLCALLASLAKAEEVANKVDMRDLHYSEVIIHVGPAPTIRLCWRPDHMERDNPVSKASPAALVLAATPPPSAFTQSTFFERRSPAPLTSSEVELHPAPALTSPAPGPAAASHGSIQQSPGLAEKASPSEVRTDWKQDALQRFKKMPDVSKYRR
jgi:hypothetical protein